jgi:hypothetical protein
LARLGREDIKKFKYRDDINARIKESFSGEIAVSPPGGDNGGIFPAREKAMGFRLHLPLRHQPESGYSFLIPSLR